MTAPMHRPELARRLGHEPDWLYRDGRLALLYAEGMPRPISMHGRPAWDRATIEAWLGRHHPARPARAANDDNTTPPAASDRDWQDRLAAAYRRA